MKELIEEVNEVDGPNATNEGHAEKEVILDTEAIEKTQAEFDSLKEENKKKVYGVEVKTEDTKTLILNYLSNDVEWRYMEAFGIPKIYDAIKKEKIKNGNVYITGLEVEALAFYLSKSNGKGMESAKNFLLMKDAIDAAYNLREADNRKENALMQNLEALKQGINVTGQD